MECIGLSILWLNFTFFHHLKPLFAFQRLRQTSVLSFRIIDFVLWYFGTGLTLPLSECTVGLCVVHISRFKEAMRSASRPGHFFTLTGFWMLRKRRIFIFVALSFLMNITWQNAKPKPVVLGFYLGSTEKHLLIGALRKNSRSCPQGKIITNNSFLLFNQQSIFFSFFGG